jgi:hypothetical protein
MYMACRHIMPNGRRCKAAALNGALFCYFHARIHSLGNDPQARLGNLRLPVPEDPAAIQLSIAQICDSLINARIDAKRAGQLLYAMQIASQHVGKCNFEIGGMNTVQSTAQSTEGDDLAPEERICDWLDICVGCPYAETCPKFDPDNKPDDDEDQDADDDE